MSQPDEHGRVAQRAAELNPKHLPPPGGVKPHRTASAHLSVRLVVMPPPGIRLEHECGNAHARSSQELALHRHRNAPSVDAVLVLYTVVARYQAREGALHKRTVRFLRKK